MRIYLDSRDLIVLAERKSDVEYESVREWLTDQGHELALSLSPILEWPNSDTVVMRTMARIEKLPHTYIAEAKIPRDELASAVEAYAAKREYQAVDPYVSRFDEVLSPFAPPATKVYLKYGLTETVFELWKTRPDLFVQDSRHSQILASSRELDRSRGEHRRHDLNFPEYVRRTLAQFDIAFPPDQVEALSSWTWDQPSRCPSMRWGYELYHQILRNTTDRAGGSDIGDLTHAGCLPYVDAMTLDRRMRNYVVQADQALSTDYATRVFADFAEVRCKV